MAYSFLNQALRNLIVYLSNIAVSKFDPKWCYYREFLELFSKSRLSQFKGIKRENFLIHLKECEFRYKENLYQILLRLIRKNLIELF
ncbi:hypothetical protein FIM76_04335 [Helicobacter pylori]|nr:hypothetical protein FIM76_04335 [Helicobacter pylori]